MEGCAAGPVCPVGRSSIFTTRQLASHATGGGGQISTKQVQFCHSRDIETAGPFYDKYKDFKFILAASVRFKLSKLAPKTILKKYLDTLCEKVAITQL